MDNQAKSSYIPFPKCVSNTELEFSATQRIISIRHPAQTFEAVMEHLLIIGHAYTDMRYQYINQMYNFYCKITLPWPLSFALHTMKTYLRRGISVREYIINESAPITSSGSSIPWGNVLL